MHNDRIRGHRRRRVIVIAVVGAVLATVTSVAVAQPAPPIDEDPMKPGIQLRVPFPSDPEFLLLAGKDRWNVRNRPAGTLAAGYGRPTGAVDSTYMTTARYPRLAPGGGLDPERRQLDVSFFDANNSRGPSSWYFARYDDGTAEVWGPGNDGNDERYVLQYSAHVDGEQIVGGIVQSTSSEGLPISIVVTTLGRLLTFEGSNYRDSLTTFDAVGGGGKQPVAAVGRSFVPKGKSALSSGTHRISFQEDGVTKARYEPRAVTDGSRFNVPDVLLVMREDGSFLPVYVHHARFSDGFEIGTPMAGIDTAFAVQAPVALDFDFACGRYYLPRLEPTMVSNLTGNIAKYLRCESGARESENLGGYMSFGRISVAVGQPGAAPQASRVRVRTSADIIDGRDHGPFNDQDECYSFGASCEYTFEVERKDEVACDLSSRPYRELAGAFDVQIAVTTTHVACVQSSPQSPNAIETLSYHQPKTPVVDKSEPAADNQTDTSNGTRSDPVFRDAQWLSTTVANLGRVTYRAQEQPTAGEEVEGAPLLEERYAFIRQPTVQLSFPCQALAGRPLRNGDFLDDCDHTTPEQTTPSASAPPYNWVSATIAGYGQVVGEEGLEDRLFVTNQPILRNPVDRRFWTILPEAGEPPLDYGSDNFAWTVEPQRYFATDLQENRENLLTADSAAFEIYEAPAAADAPPLFLAQVGRPTTSDVLIELIDDAPVLRETDSFPVAVLQAPPIVTGLGQQTDFTPEFGVSSGSGTSTETSKSTRLGTHAGVEATFTAGAGIGGNEVTLGGGFAVNFSFMNEVEQSLGQSVEVNTTEGYGGSFTEHTVVVRSLRQYVWRAKVIEDPTGLATGDEFDYAVPDGEVTQAVPLSVLEKDQPGLYGRGTAENPSRGVLRDSIDRMLAGAVPGNPATYLTGAVQPQPSSVLGRNGGPCKGDFTPPDNLSSLRGDLPPAVNPTNPFYASDPNAPVGPSIVTSQRHTVQLGNDLTESANISFSESTDRSLLTSKSFDFGVTGILKAEAEVSLGVASNLEVEVTAGIDSGWSTGAGVTDSVSSGTSLDTVMGNIPYTAEETGAWLENERYDWRMYMCKAQLGPFGLLTDVWVQGYVVDGYGGSGGITDLDPVSLVAPVAGAVVHADPGDLGDDSATVLRCSSDDVENGFHFDHPAGTVRGYLVEYENLTSGGRVQRYLDLASAPRDFNEAFKTDDEDDRPGVADRPDCVVLKAGNFEDGALYRWRTVADGFVTNSETSEWEHFRPQVFPPDQTISVRRPVTLEDGSVLIDIDDPVFVTSLRHEVVVSRVDGGTRTEVARRAGVRSTYRTPVLEPGDYVAEVVGYNSHVLEEFSRAETPLVTVPFTVAKRLQAQFRWQCLNDPCLTSEAVRFSDESTTAEGVPIVSWDWDFGDGHGSSEPDPEHEYGAMPADGSGGYDVTLKVVDATGRLSTLTQQVQVAEPTFDPPVASFTHDTCGVDDGTAVECVPTGEPVTFDASASQAPAGSISAWRWDFGDGTTAEITDPAATTATHVYERPGDYRVQLRVADQFGQLSEPISSVVRIANRPAVVEITNDGDFVVFEDEPASFTAVVDDPDGDASAADITWRFVDSAPDQATGPTVVHTWDTPGTKTVEVTVIDEGGTITSTTFDVDVVAGPVADFRWSCSYLGRCNTLAAVGFRDLSTDDQAPIIAWHWDFGNGWTSTQQHARYRYPRAGTYIVTLTVTDARGKRASVTHPISVSFI